MAEKTRNVFEQLQESINKVAEQLHDANDALYVVATETMDLNEKLGNLIAKLDDILTGKVQIKIQTSVAENEQMINQVIETAPKTELQLPTGKEKKK